MITSKNAQCHRLWVLLFLLTFAGQLFAACDHSVEVTVTPVEMNDMSLPCHGEDRQEMADGSTMMTDDLKADSCCDTGCSMTGCFASGVILNSSSTVVIHPVYANNTFIQTLFTSHPSSSLYRPPILG